MTSETPGGVATMTLGEIEKRAAVFAKVRGELAMVLDALRTTLESEKKRLIRPIKELAAKAAEAEANLRSAIESAPELFQRPKTLSLHGVKVGYRTNAGKIAFEDEDTVLKLMQRYFEDRLDLLVRVKRNVNKDALKALTAPELAKLGCRIEGAGEEVVVSVVDDEVEKLVGKLIEDMVGVILEEERQAA